MVRYDYFRYVYTQFGMLSLSGTEHCCHIKKKKIAIKHKYYINIKTILEAIF